MIVKKKIPLPADKFVGARVRARRVELGKSQEWLGDQCGITFQQIQKYEKGANRIGASRLIQIASHLKCDPSYFMSGAPGMGTTLVPAIDEKLVSFAADRRGNDIVSAWPKLTPNVRDAIHGIIMATAEAE